MIKTRHILGISGGKDSSALAIYMSQKYPDIDMEYFFTDTGEELPEVYEFLNRLEGHLGKEILKLNPDREFSFWLKQYNHFLPSAKARWCTLNMKLKPLEKWIKKDLDNGVQINSYVGIRYDESYREGHQSHSKNYKVILPFQKDRIDRSEVLSILENSGIGVPKYYDWRSRSGCTFCFFQRKIEWVRLRERHPDAFERAKKLEKTALSHGSPFTWSESESLIDLEKPERIEAIKKNYEVRRQRALDKRRKNPMDPDEFVDDDELFGQGKMCYTCHK